MSLETVDSPASGEASRFYTAVRKCFALSLRVFFRQVQVEGVENVPPRGGGLLIAWHPNAVIDGMLLAAECPRPIAFGARHGLFDVPLLGWILRRTGTVPIYRARDLPEWRLHDRRAANEESLERLAEAVASGRLASLFPEGQSHDASHPVRLKTGAARVYDRARALEACPDPFVIPVGLHYGAKDRGRSTVLVRFLPPLDIPDSLASAPAGEDDEARYARLRSLTDLFEGVIHETALATEDWRAHELIHRTRKLMRAELALRRESNPGPATPSEKRAGFARVWTAYRVVAERDPARTEALSNRLVVYDQRLRELGLDDHELDDIDDAAGLALPLAIARAVGLLTLLAPMALIGYVTSGPTALLLLGLARAFGREAKDRATIKVLGGMLLLPVTWTAVGLVAAYGATRLFSWGSNVGPAVFAGLAATLASILGVPAVFAFARIFHETMRRVRTRAARARHREVVDRLRGMRAALFDALVDETVDLELPGSVRRDGRVEPGP